MPNPRDYLQDKKERKDKMTSPFNTGMQASPMRKEPKKKDKSIEERKRHLESQLAELRKQAAQDKTIDPTEQQRFTQELKEAKEEYKSTIKRANMAEALSQLAKDIGKLGAGLYGLKTGVDMSGVKFRDIDLEPMKRRAERELGRDISEISKRREAGLMKAKRASEREIDLLKDELNAVYREQSRLDRQRQQQIRENLKAQKEALKEEAKINKEAQKKLEALEKAESELDRAQAADEDEKIKFVDRALDALQAGDFTAEEINKTLYTKERPWYKFWGEKTELEQKEPEEAKKGIQRLKEKLQGLQQPQQNVQIMEDPRTGKRYKIDTVTGQNLGEVK